MPTNQLTLNTHAENIIPEHVIMSTKNELSWSKYLLFDLL